MTNLRGAELRKAVVAEWNKRELDMGQIGAMFGKSRSRISRILRDARQLGMAVAEGAGHPYRWHTGVGRSPSGDDPYAKAMVAPQRAPAGSKMPASSGEARTP